MHRINQKSPMSPISVVSRLLDFGLRTVLFATLWWTLNNGSADSWIMGIPVVIIAILLSISVLPLNKWNISLFGALLFFAYFLRKSLLSSIDVASRVLRPSMPLNPGLIQYQLRLEGEIARTIMANTASLLPGTLSVNIEGDALIVHALDQNVPVVEELRILEKRVAGIYGIQFNEEMS